MIEQELGIFDKAQKYAWDHSVPLNITLEITMSCNLRCVHCYNFDRTGASPKPPQADPLKPAEILDIIDQVAAAGALFIGFTGGEALLHPHLNDFVRRARERHCMVKIKSNATLLTRERADALVTAGASQIDVSVYGSTAETHDRFTTVKGSFERTVRGILAARDAGLTVQLSYVLTRHNVLELEAMLAQATAWKVGCVFSTELTARYDGTTSSRDERVTPAQFEAILQGPLGERFGHYNETESVQCSCARTVAGISASGEVYPCIGAPIACGNLRETTFAKIWEGSSTMQRIRALELTDFPKCAPCKDRKWCMRSSGSVYTDTGDYTGPEEMECQLAALRHEYDSRP